MKFSQILVVVMAIIGLTTFLFPQIVDEPSFKDNMVLLCRIGMAIFLIEVVPAFIRKIKNETIVDLISLTVVPFTTALAIYLVNPDLDTHIFEIIIVLMIFVSLKITVILGTVASE